MIKKFFYIGLLVLLCECSAKVYFVNPVSIHAELQVLADMIENAEDNGKQLKREDRDKLEEQLEKTKKKIVLLKAQLNPVQVSVRSLIDYGENREKIQALKKEKVGCYSANNCMQCLDEVNLKEQEIYAESFKKPLSAFCAAYPHDLSVKDYIHKANQVMKIFENIIKRYNAINNKK